MPTKPTDTVQQIATDTNFSTSPVVAVNGQPTKVALVDPAEGLVPGRAAGAANLNWLWNVANKFVQWVKDGSNAADLDAHIVETDALGQISTAALLVPDGTGYNYGIIASNSETGDAAARTILATQTDDGIAIEGRNTAGAGSAVKGTCGGTGGHGVHGVASGTGIGGGIYGDGQGSQKAGIIAERTLDNDAPALLLTGDHAAPARGLLTIDRQTTEPTIHNIGDFYCSSVDMRIADNGRWNTIGHRAEGWISEVAYYNNMVGSLVVPDSGSYTDVVEITVTPARVGMVVVHGTLNVTPDSGSTTSLTLRLYDNTAPVALLTANDDAKGQRSIRFTYQLPSTASRTFKLQAESFGDGSAVNYATLTVDGIYEI